MRIRLHLAVLFGYLCVTVAFAWPLPLHFSSTFLGPVDSDLGVYVWNLWVFRHEIVAHGHFPFLTLEILPMTPPVALTLHNYTTAANILAFPLLPLLGIVATFNLLTLLSPVAAAYSMFLLARRLTRDAAASWLAGLAFGFSPFMSARAMEHFSLVQAAPLPVFALVFDRLRSAPSPRLGVAAGACVAWAFLSDPYYAVYCVLIAAALLGDTMFSVRFIRVPAPVIASRVLTLLVICLAGLVAGILLRGGGQLDVMGVRVSMTRLYNPILALSLLLTARLALSIRPIVARVTSLPPFRVVAATAFTCAALLSPVLSAMQFHESRWISPRVLWRSSAPGLDLLSFFVPNPTHPLFGWLFEDGLRQSPGGFVENVAAIPWTVIVCVTFGAWFAWRRMPRFWLLLTAGFTLLALGPFVRIAGVMTYVPTPWALLRYVPVIGAARMPPRFSIVVMLGMAVLLAFAMRELRALVRRPRLFTAGVGMLLVIELVPAPRVLHTAAVPSVYSAIAEDERPLRVLNLPFGLRDGLSSYGNTTAAWQYYQTVHQKPILGGYVSRLPQADIDYYQSRRVLRHLMTLSAGRSTSAERTIEAIARARETRNELRIGWVVIDTRRCSTELIEFAREAFELRFVTSDGPHHLYRSRLLDETPAP